jgi:signal recognition particle receptor subunit beta
VIPVTTVITRLRYGSKPRAVVVRFDGTAMEVDLPVVDEFISEAKNPANEKNVEVVDIELPSIEPYAGLRLVDTPGLGSIFKYNTDISEEWLPRVGAAIVAISSDRPLSENDLALIRQLMEFTPRVVLLLTKVDLLSKEQRKEVVQFFRDSLKREFNMDFQILLYSTVEERDLHKGSFDEFLVGLSRNRETEFRGIVQHKVRSLARQCLAYLDIALTASDKADSDREHLRKLVLDEKVNYELMQSELSLITRESMQQTRTLIAAYLDDVHRAKLFKKLLFRLSRTCPTGRETCGN